MRLDLLYGTFSCVPGFMARHRQKPAVLDIRFDKFTIPSLEDLADRGIFAVAIKRYLSGTDQYLPPCNDLFVFTERVKKYMSKNMILFWRRSVINEEYRYTWDNDCTEMKAKAHKVQSIEASMLSRKNFAVQLLMRARTWASQTTFTSF